MKKILLALAVTFSLSCVGSVPALAAVVTPPAPHVDTIIECYTGSVSVGQPILIKVRHENWDCTAQSFSRFSAGVLGNSAAGGSMTNVGLWGPFPRWMGVSIPAGTNSLGLCDPFGADTPAQTGYSLFKVMQAAPAALKGTIATVYVNTMDRMGREIGSDTCEIYVK